MNPRKGMAKGEGSKEGLVLGPGVLLMETAPVGPVLSQPQMVTGCLTAPDIWEDKNPREGPQGREHQLQTLWLKKGPLTVNCVPTRFLLRVEEPSVPLEAKKAPQM